MWISKSFSKRCNPKESLRSLRRFADICNTSPLAGLVQAPCRFYLIDKSSLDKTVYAGGGWYCSENRAHHRKPAGIIAQGSGSVETVGCQTVARDEFKGVFVSPDLTVVEKYCAEEPMLAQEMFWATPVMPNINAELTDPDALAGFCSETRIGISCGFTGRTRFTQSSQVHHSAQPHPLHKQRSGPENQIDAAGRGWFSNMGAILAVKNELGMTDKREAGLGMAPICWLD
jgi:hypothetical protein